MRRKKTGKILLAVLMVLVMSLGSTLAGFAAPILGNAGFESGDFTDWMLYLPAGAEADVVDSYLEYEPIEGEYFAIIKTDGPGSYSTLSQTVMAEAGDIIEGFAFFDYEDYHPYNDNAKVTIQWGCMEAIVYEQQGSWLENYENTPWEYWCFVVPEAGMYTVVAKISNSLDSVLDSYMGLDTVNTAEIDMDIKPGDPNYINLTQQGKLPIGILGSETFDVMEIVPETIRIGEVGLYEKQNGKLMFAFEDVNWDGYMDMICHFSVVELVDAGELNECTMGLTLTGSLLDPGYYFCAFDEVIIE